MDDPCSSQPPPQGGPAEELHGGLASALAELDAGEYEWFSATAGGVERLNAAPKPVLLKHEKRAFILRRKTTSRHKVEELAQQVGSTSTAGAGLDQYDYEKKYPPDEPDQALGPNARIWRVYLDEARQFDMDMVDNIRDTVDVILVFAGLFSAVVGTLVTEASTSLKPDYTQITAALLTELISVQRAIASNISVSSIPSSSLHLESPPTSTASSTDFWVNALWFTSLAISLAIALVSVLVRQWLHAYVTPTSGTPKDQSHIRHFRYMGIEQWQVPLIAGLLPIMLHLSLFLFFIGLVVFLRDLDRTIAAVVTGIFLVVFFVYTVANLWPVFNIQCPYKTPLSDSIMSTSRRILSALRETRHARKPSPLEPSNIPSSSERTSAHTSSQKLRGGQCWTMKEVESQAVRARIDTLSVQMLSWLSSASSNPSIRGVAIHAVPDLPIEFTGSKILRDALLPDVCSRMEIIHRSWANGTYKLTPDIEERLYLIAHAHLALDPNAHPRLANRDGTKFFQGDRCHWGFYEMVGRRIMANSSIGHERLQSLRHVYLSPNHRSRDPWALRVPSPQDLVKLQPRATSDRVWIALLQSAIIGVREGPASNQSNFPGWPALSPLLQLASQPMECNFDIIQSTLIYAYLCHLTRPGTTKVEDHPLLDVVLFYSEIYGNLASRLEEFQQAVNHYRARLCIHVLSHAVPAQPSSALTLESVIADILVEQFEMESIMVSKLAWTPFRPEPAIEERLLWFVPNPVFPDGSVTRYLKTAHSLSTLSMILLHLDSPRILDAFRQNRILESMHSMHGILLCPPGRPMMLEDEVTKYVQAVLECPRLEQQQRHVEYIFDHLKEICAWLIFSRRLRVDGFRQCVLPLLSRYPGHSQWDVVVDTLMDSWMLAGEDREVVEELIRQVTGTRRKLLADSDRQKRSPSRFLFRMGVGRRRNVVGVKQVAEA